MAMCVIIMYRTALMLAAERGMTAVCEYLLSRGADVIATDQQGLAVILLVMVLIFFCFHHWKLMLQITML